MPATSKKAPVSDEWMSQPVAAAALGISRQMVLAYVARGELVSTVVADRIVISRVSVEQLAIELEKSA